MIQQLRSFAELHANELETMAQELDQTGAPDVAFRLRSYRDLQRDEAAMVVDELSDIRTDLATSAAAEPASERPLAVPGDPAAHSPRRAKWLAEQAAEAERLRQPVSRRELFGRAAADSEEEARQD